MVQEIGDDISGMGLAAALIAGWREAIGLAMSLMQGIRVMQIESEQQCQSSAPLHKKKQQGHANIIPRLSPPACARAPAPAQHHPRVVAAFAGTLAVTQPKHWKQNPLC